MIRCATKGVRIEICIYRKIIWTWVLQSSNEIVSQNVISINMNSQNLRTAISDTHEKSF